MSSYLDDLDRGDMPAQLVAILGESRAASRSLLLSGALTLPLPGLPRATGESVDFVRRIRASLEEFRLRWPLFRSLLVPVTLTFLVIPPEQGKDLDNIALTVLPIAHEVLRPHISPRLLSPAYGGEPDPRLDAALARLKSVNARSVCAYQVIELPRIPRDPPEGTLHLALGCTPTGVGGAAPLPTSAQLSTRLNSTAHGVTVCREASSLAGNRGIDPQAEEQSRNPTKSTFD